MGYVIPGAVRLEDVAKNTNDQIKKGLIKALYSTNNVLKSVYFINSDADKMTGARLSSDDLPTGQKYGQYNVIPEPSRTTMRQHQEGSYLVRDRVVMDVRLMRKKNQIVDPIELQTQGIMEYWARRINYDFIYGDPNAAGADPGSLVGLATRLDNPAKYDHAADCKVDFGGVNLSPSMTKQSAINAYMLVDKLLYKLNAPDGKGVIIYANDDFLRAFSAAGKTADNGSGFAVNKDNYDRDVLTYKGAELRDIGRGLGSTEPQIITSTENANGTPGASTFTSIYAIKFGSTDAMGWHDGEWTLKRAGNDTGFAQNFALDYLFGLFHAHNRTIARGYDIRIA